MRIRIISFLFLLSFNLFASEDKEMKDLFKKYDQLMQEHNIELVEEIFTENFLRENGGKEEFIAKIKELPKSKKKNRLSKLLQRWKKSRFGKMFFVRVQEEGSSIQHHSQFIVIRAENGQLQIDGTVSDAE